MRINIDDDASRAREGGIQDGEVESEGTGTRDDAFDQATDQRRQRDLPSDTSQDEDHTGDGDHDSTTEAHGEEAGSYADDFGHADGETKPARPHALPHERPRAEVIDPHIVPAGPDHPADHPADRTRAAASQTGHVLQPMLPRAPTLASLLFPLGRRMARKAARRALALCICALPLTFVFLAHTLFLSPRAHTSFAATAAGESEAAGAQLRLLPNLRGRADPLAERGEVASSTSSVAAAGASRRSETAAQPRHWHTPRGWHATAADPRVHAGMTNRRTSEGAQEAADPAAEAQHRQCERASPAENHAHMIPFVVCRCSVSLVGVQPCRFLLSLSGTGTFCQ